MSNNHQRRPQTLASAAAPTNQRPVIALDAWESAVPLQEDQIESVNDWKVHCEQKPLPLKFEEEQTAPVSRPGTPLRGLKQKEGSLRSSRPGTPVGNPHPNVRGRHPLHPVNPIHTPQQFHDWFALIDRSMQHSQEAHFRSHLSRLNEHSDKCKGLSQKLEQVNDQVLQMRAAWQGVEDGGRSLQEASEQLLKEKDRLVNVTDAISARLAYFQELERATRMLNHPGEDLVLQPDFLIMVERVDICLEYLQNHRDYHEADIYILRFQQCLIRAMSLIKIFFTATIRSLAVDVERQMGEKTISTMSVNHLLYPKFDAMGAQMSPLLAELERRTIAYPSDLKSLLEECQMAYLAARKTLLTPRLATEIKGLDPVNSELIELTRAGCGYLRQLCGDEFILYRRFFNSGAEKLYRYLETLCDFLYDDLRPRILHEQRINVLCEVCTVLQALMILGNDISTSESTSDEEEDANESVVPQTPADETESNGLQRLQIGQLLQMILQDAQTRLVFKAQAIIQSEIRLHIPTENDLRYPEKLIEYRKSISQRPKQEVVSENSSDDLPSVDVQQTWYPSVQKTSWMMALLQQFVKAKSYFSPIIFRDIAQEAISFCRESLEVAAQRISAKEERVGPIDSKLFLIRHLIVLKDLADGIKVSLGDVQADAPQLGTTDSFFGASLFRPVALLGSFAYLGVPKLLSGAETPLNIDQELKIVCERLISTCVAKATLPVKSFVERSSAYLDAFSTNQATDKHDLLSQQFATPKQALETNQEFKVVCEREVRFWVSRVRLYLDDDRMVAALFTPLQHQIVEEYAMFRGLLAGRYGPELLREAYTEHGLLTSLRQWDEVVS